MDKKIRIVISLLGGLIVFGTALFPAAGTEAYELDAAIGALYGIESAHVSTLKTQNDSETDTQAMQQIEPEQSRQSAGFELASIEPNSFESVYTPDGADELPDEQLKSTAAILPQAKTCEELDAMVHDPENFFTYSEQDMIYVARVVYAEARGEIFDGQVAVASVVLNRFESGDFGPTVKSIVFARSQFAVSKKYSEQALDAVQQAVANRGMFPKDMYYFQASKSRNWRNFEYYTRIGGHSFYCAAN